jgi:hypothetical protein
MPNQKISELTTIVTVDNAVDLFPIVDTSANTTKKITPTALKSALALDNVNNTSDANKPVSTAQQDALNAKVTGNTAIVAATKTKITYDAKGLVTAGDILDAADMPTGINAANIGAGVVSSTEFGYLDGVTSAIQTQLNAKQATLVSGTNIKTINSTSLLGSGDITISASPSGVAGAIQFSDGSAFASDATKFFWNNTFKGLGIGTNSVIASLTIRGNGSTNATRALFIQNSGGTALFAMNDDGETNFTNIIQGPTLKASANLSVGTTLTSARTHIVGSGSTSATTSLLVQNSAGNNALQIKDDTSVSFPSNSPNYQVMIGGQTGTNKNGLSIGYTISGVVFSQGGLFCNPNTATNELYGNNNSILSFKDGEILIKNANNGAAISNPSAILTIDSTTKGFLPPRMTTTQKNAIATPAAGLVVYDSTTNKLCCYNGSTWNDLF